MPSAPASASTHASSRAIMYVSDARTSSVNVFRIDDGRKVGTIPYPMAPGGIKFATGVGLGTDAKDDLWASFSFDNGRNYPGKIVIFGYAAGRSHWFTAIAGGCCGTPNLSVSSGGEIAEALGFFPPDYGGGIGFIEPGKKYVGRYNLALLGAVYDAYDSDGTLWAGGVDAGFRTHVGFIRRGSPRFEEIAPKPAAALGPMAVDGARNVLIASDGFAAAYDRHGRLAYRVALNRAAAVVGIALARDGSKLYVAEKTGTVLAYRFPAGGFPLATYHVGGTPYAIALGSF